MCVCMKDVCVCVLVKYNMYVCVCTYELHIIHTVCECTCGKCVCMYEICAA